MEILVCIKRVIDDSAVLSLDNLEGASKIVNPYDGYALELALRHVQEHGGEITVLTAGDKETESVLYQGLACGADKAVRIDCGEHTGDYARTIREGVRELEQMRGKPYDLILVGKEAFDTMSGGTGPKLAHLLERGFLSRVVGFDGDTADTQTDEGKQTYRWLPPFVFSVERFGNDLRYPTLKNKLAARKKEIERIEPGMRGRHPSDEKKYSAFPKKAGCIPIQPESVQESVQKIREIIEEKKRGGK